MKLKSLIVILIQNFSFGSYLITIAYQDIFKTAILNKKTFEGTLEGKTQLFGVTKINCKEFHFLWIYQKAVFQSTCCSSAFHLWKLCVNQRKLVADCRLTILLNFNYFSRNF